MKKLFFLLAMCSILTFISCKKDKDETPSEFMTASINGNTFTAKTLDASLTSFLGPEIIYSIGTNNDETFSISFNISPDSPVNEVNVVSEPTSSIVFTDADENRFLTEGVFEITSNDTQAKIIEGTFSFIATNEMDDTDIYEITNGSFRFIYNR